MRQISLVVMASLSLFGAAGSSHSILARDSEPPRDFLSIEEIVDNSRPSIVAVSHRGRGERTQGLGTGFVVSKDGLIATNLHVIGEARSVDVEFNDGLSLPVVEIYAWDRSLDLAIIRVDATNLKPIKLGDSDTVSQGTELVALGNPQGLRYSAVKGIVSAIRELDEENSSGLIQVAMPIEPGNSGGPIVNLSGEVFGVVTFKEAFSDNVGFAMPVNFVKALLENPNRVPMDRWVTIGALRQDQWTTVNGGSWSQRAGVITAAGDYGEGFGGRTLCISEQSVPSVPYEVSAEVRLHQEDGAAGIAFSSDGGQIHYGFYPSAGQLRLTRFDGPDVYSWTVLEQVGSGAYEPGAWNQLRVRVEKNRIVCFVNGEKVIESNDSELRTGRAGICKFRHTQADFRKFRLGENLEPETVPEDVLASLRQVIDSLDHAHLRVGEPIPQVLADNPVVSRDLLAVRANELEEKARRTRLLAERVHARAVTDDIAQLVDGVPDDKIELFRVGLLVSRLANPDLEIEIYLEELERMTHELSTIVTEKSTDTEKLMTLNQFLFEEHGFHGSRSNYYHRSNSYLNEVLDDREGLPISLSIIYLELARRIGVDHLSGVDLPGHFITQYQPSNGKRRFIDVFAGGETLTKRQLENLVFDLTGGKLRANHLKPASNKSIILRLLNNLIGLELAESFPNQALPYLDVYIAVSPDSPGQRFSRAVINFQNGHHSLARQDIEWLLKNDSPGPNIERLERLLEHLEDTDDTSSSE